MALTAPLNKSLVFTTPSARPRGSIRIRTTCTALRLYSCPKLNLF